MTPDSGKSFLWRKAALWWASLFLWALFAYSLRLWLIPFHILLVWLIARGSRLAAAAYAIPMLMMCYAFIAMMWPLGPLNLIGPLALCAGVAAVIASNRAPWSWPCLAAGVLLNGLNRFPLAIGLADSLLLGSLAVWLWPRVTRAAPLPAFPALLLLFTLPCFSRLAFFYHRNTPELVPVINAQPGVRVLLTADASPALGANPRVAIPDCSGRRLLIGTAMSPMLTRLHLPTHEAVSLLKGKASDLIATDCGGKLILMGGNNTLRLYLISEASLNVLWQSPSLGAQVSYMAHFPERKLIFFGEDVGFKLWKLDYRSPNAPKLTTHHIPVYDLAPYGNELIVASKGRLLSLDPETLQENRRALLPVAIQPQLAVDANRRRIYASDILGGRVLVYDALNFQSKPSLRTGWGTRYLWVHPGTGRLATLNYFSGEFAVWDPATGLKTRSLQIGAQGRALTENHEGNALYALTNAGLIQIRQSVFTWKTTHGQ